MLPLHSPQAVPEGSPCRRLQIRSAADSPQMGDSGYPHLNWLTTEAGALTPSCANAFSRPPSLHPAGQIAEVAFDLGKREREGCRQVPYGRAPQHLGSVTLSETALALRIHAEWLVAWKGLPVTQWSSLCTWLLLRLVRKPTADHKMT